MSSLYHLYVFFVFTILLMEVEVTLIRECSIATSSVALVRLFTSMQSVMGFQDAFLIEGAFTTWPRTFVIFLLSVMLLMYFESYLFPIRCIASRVTANELSDLLVDLFVNFETMPLYEILSTTWEIANMHGMLTYMLPDKLFSLK